MSKRKKRIIILLMIVAVLVILWQIMFPRIYMRFFFITELAPVVDPPAEAFTAYDITLENGQSASIDGLTMTLPNDLTLRETNDKYSIVYDYDHPEPAIGSIVLSGAQDVSHMDLTVKENAETLMSEYFYQTSCRNLTKGYEALGYGTPDSAYNVYKAAALLEADNYSFWNWQQNYAYAMCCGFHATIFYHPFYDNRYIYETEDVCGIVFYNDMTSMHHAYAYMFSTDDLNTMYTLSLSSISQEDIYGMLNSIVIE